MVLTNLLCNSDYENASYKEDYPLHFEAYCGNCEILSIKDFDDIKYTDRNWQNPVHILASKGLIQVLSYNKVEKILDFEGYTPLHYFANQDDHLDRLIAVPDIMLYKTSKGVTPLHILAIRGKIEVLKHPFVSKIRDISKNTLLHVLAEKGVKEVLNHPDVGNVLDCNDNTPLHTLALKNVIEVINHPKSHYVKNSIGSTPLHILAKRGRTEVLSNEFCDLVEDSSGKTPKDYIEVK